MLRRLCIFWLWAAQVPLQALSGQPEPPGQPAPNPWLSEDAILVANNGIRVPLGRAAFVDPVNDLVLQTRPGDRCGVTVLDDGPPGRRPGRLSPEKFPCDFGPRDVKYTHYGSEIPAGHRVRLQLRYDTGGQSVVVPFTVEVEVVFARLELVAKNAPLSVRRPRGTSDAIDRSILDFAYDRESHKCGVTRLADGGRRPRYGRLLDGGKLAQMMDCDELTRAGVRYRHTSRGTFPDRDAVPMVAELRDRGGNVARREHFHLTVRIAGGRENTAPGPSLLAMMTMEVSQSAMTAFTPEMLAADDAESDPGDLLFNITSWPSLEEGYVVSTDDQNSPIASFYQRDLRDLKIAYKPPSRDADADVIFQLEFQVLDPDGASSDPFAFTVVVKPMNWLAPALARNAGQLLYEGQSRPLTTDNLEIADADDLGAVSVRVLGGPRHGVLLVRGTRRDGFAAPDLAAGAVVYRHDGSDAYSDNVVLEMTDGRHHVDFLFPITVVPVDDEPPVVESNGGLVVFHGQTRAVPALALGATDVDSEDATVRFTVVPPFSDIGATLLRQSDAPEDPSSWKFNSEEEVYEKEVREWLQKDITDGNLFYRHVGPRVATAIADKVVFTLRDDNDPPNESGRVTFVIRVLPVDDMAPELHPGATLRMTVEEYELRPSRYRRAERVLRSAERRKGHVGCFSLQRRGQGGQNIPRRPVPDLVGEGPGRRSLGEHGPEEGLLGEDHFRRRRH
ncbi:FRAS1-related extracellular matrix protein 2-like [Stigmatopora argus]